MFIGYCDDEAKALLLNIAKEYQAEDYVDFLGYCKSIDSYYAKATAFLMCSENEAMGRTTVEAFWNGCLVLGRNSGGTSELVKDGVTGYLYNTTKELAVLMSSVINKDNSILVNNARNFAIENFTEENYGKTIDSIYQTIL